VKHALWTSVARAFRRMALPLASYYAVTLALPLANGAAQSGDAFIKHALVVLIVPPVAIVLACAFHSIAYAFGSACRSTLAHQRARKTASRDVSNPAQC